MSSGIQLTTSFDLLQWVFYFTKPKAEINGVEFPLKWGLQVAAFPPGNYRMKVWVPYLFGPACVGQIDLAVYAGHVTVVTYGTPMFVFSSGKMRVHGTKPWGS